ncbi:MAG TPA: BON domain-containing protein [Gemmataceae bacterium]|nr:BON domain-containing protein [Gemmataceae bacterium]
MPRLESSTLPPERREELERHIQDRTGRRVHGLSVEVRDERVVLRGRTTSYYIKQLAQHSVWDVLPQAPLENGIVVE